MSSLLRVLFLAAALAGCAGPGHVRFDNETCFIDDAPATLAQVEARQAAVTERIAGRQPLLVVITILIVALAGMSHVEKLVLLFSARRSDAKGLGERLRAALDRYRAHPLRYFAIVGVTFSMLLVAGSCYIYLDADKRASERALGMLQFCHLALRTAEEKGVLDEQRRNLDAISATAGDIRSLVDKLPPDEQHKAQQIIEQMNGALGKQSKLMGQYLQRSDETANARLQLIDQELANLKSLPTGIHDLSNHVGNLENQLNTRLGAGDAKLTALQTSVQTLVNRPERTCPACVCESSRPPHSDGGAGK